MAVACGERGAVCADGLVSGADLLLLLAVVQVQALCKVCLSLVVFLLFSGMDVLMARYNPEAWRHQIEWWAQCYQFSSNTTCLFWVYNQAVPALAGNDAAFIRA